MAGAGSLECDAEQERDGEAVKTKNIGTDKNNKEKLIRREYPQVEPRVPRRFVKRNDKRKRQEENQPALAKETHQIPDAARERGEVVPGCSRFGEVGVGRDAAKVLGFECDDCRVRGEC